MRGARVLGLLVAGVAFAASGSVSHVLHAQTKPAASARNDAAARAALARARAAYAKVKTARAEFVQEIRNPLTGRTVQSRGTLVQQRPGKLAITFTEPAGDRVVSDGTHLWVFLPSSAPGQVLRFPAGEGGTGGVDLAATILEAPDDAYTLADAGERVVDGRTLRGVALTQKPNALAPFATATVWIASDDASVREVQVGDAQGVARTIRITSWTPNVSVPASAFRFRVPQGVRVVEP